MFKKVIIVIAAAVLLLTSIPALAALPSKTTRDMTRIVGIESENGNARQTLIYIRAEPTDFANETLQSFVAHKNKNKNIADFFSVEMQQSMLKLLPADTDLKKMILSEFVSLGIGDYIASYGDITCTFQFPTDYKEKKPVVAMLGYLGAQGETVWVPLKTEALNGTLVIVFPSEVLLAAGHDVVLAVLSD